MQQVWLCGNCRSLNNAEARRCYRCRSARSESERLPDGSEPSAPGLAATPRPNPSLFGAMVIGLAVAVTATALWYWFDTSTTGRRALLFSWTIGWAIGLAVLVGGRGRSSTPIVAFSVLLTIGTLVVGEYLLISHYLAVGAGQQVDGIVVVPPRAVIDALVPALESAPLRPVLWVLAVAGSFVVPWRALVGD